MQKRTRLQGMGLGGWLVVAGLMVAGAAQGQAYPQAGYPQAGYPPTDSVQAGAQALGETGVDTGVDPPAVVGRLSQVLGNVSVEPASVEQFTAAELNAPLTSGDRVYADQGSLAEVEGGAFALRVGQYTDVTLTSVTEALAQFGLASGSVHLRTFQLQPGTTAEVDTPSVAVTVLQPGDVRVDVAPSAGTTVVTVLSGQVQVDGNGIQQVMEAGERLLLRGSDPVSAQFVGTVAPDGLDQFSGDRDANYQASLQAEQPYVNADTVGADALADAGQWESDPSYGAVWYPAGVGVDWEPYRNGHWTWVAPWGWTWVEAEPWGFAPFHYGRWARVGVRWGWIPGPVFVRPVYSPALVVFVGGGGGLTGWFPLGPGEVYQPWYHASPLYLNRVNVSNLYSRDQRQVQAIYNQRGQNQFAVSEQRYSNRGATVAMPQAQFAAGGRADRSQVGLNASAAANLQLLPHPLVSPERTMVVASPTRFAPQSARPVLASREDHALPAGSAVTGTRGGSVPSTTAAPIERGGAQPGSSQPAQTEGRGARPSYSQPSSSQPSYGQPSYSQPGSKAATAPAAPATPSAPAGVPAGVRQGSYRQAIEGSTPAIPPAAAAPAAPQVLVNRAVPAPTRPSFEQQRQAIQQSDPGRPLGPSQLENLRQGQPAGPPQQREAPHPPAAAPAARPQPAAQPAKGDDHRH